MAKASPPTIELDYAGFAQLLSYFGRKRDPVKLKHRIDAAWSTLLEGGSSDVALTTAAVAAARVAGSLPWDYAGMEDLAHGAKKTPKRQTSNYERDVAGNPLMTTSPSGHLRAKSSLRKAK